MTLSETISTAEGRINEAVESGRTRLRAVVDTAEEGVEASIPRVRENIQILRERAFEDAQRVGGYITEGLSWAAGWLPKVQLPLPETAPSAEELAGIYFDNVGRALDLQRKITLEWIAAIGNSKPAAAKAKATRAAKEARSAAA